MDNKPKDKFKYLEVIFLTLGWLIREESKIEDYIILYQYWYLGSHLN